MHSTASRAERIAATLGRGLLACAVLGLTMSASAALVLERRIELPAVQGRIDHISVDVEGHRLFVAALGSNAVEVVDFEAGRRTARITGLREPQGIAYWPAARRMFVANGSGGGVRVFDGEKEMPNGGAGALDDADNLSFNGSAKTLYVGYGNALAALDPDTLQITQHIALEGHPESFQLDASSPLAYVNVPSARHIAVVDRAKGRVVATWPITAAARNFPMALDSPRDRLYVATRQPALVLTFELPRGREVGRIHACGDADDLFVDPSQRQLYLICGEGLIEVLRTSSSGSPQVIERIATATGARTGLFVPELNKLFVAAPPRPGSTAEILVFRTR